MFLRLRTPILPPHSGDRLVPILQDGRLMPVNCLFSKGSGAESYQFGVPRTLVTQEKRKVER